MTTKQLFYLESQEKDFDIVEFCKEHRSVQWRPVGKSNYQVRFNDHESWVDAEAFRSNYVNKVLKDLADRVTQASNIISPYDIFLALPSEITKDAFAASVRGKIDRGDLYTKSSYQAANQKASEAVANYNALVEKYNALAEQCDSLHKRVSSLQNKQKQLIERVDNEIGLMGLSKKDWIKITDELNFR